MSKTIEATSLRAVAPHFQRSINLTYDAGNSDYIAGYIPTPNGAKTLANILDNTAEGKNQRTHVLHAAYGSGKSLLGLVLNAFVKNDLPAQSTLGLVLDRLNRVFPTEAERIEAFRSSGRRLLPVILSGFEGPLNLALPRALAQTLQQQGLGDLRPRTQFKAALDMITLWERTYLDVYHRLDERLTQEGITLSELLAGLELMEPAALTLFENIYPTLTAGARFDRYAGQSLMDAFHTTAEALRAVGYDGIMIIWDEFGRFIEAKVGDAFGPEAALLQTFAEFCNRSGSHQVHLVLITHRLLSGYAADLPLTYQQEWARIAERFGTHDVASDPLVTYRLIAEALTTPDSMAWSFFADKYRLIFDDLTARSLELALFQDLDDVTLRQQIVERVWPLHPLTVYALPRLAGRVAQNERTLFTFLAADEPNTLTTYLGYLGGGWGVVGLEVVWDYFSEAIRTDTGPGGTHAIWSGVMYALSKIPTNEDQSALAAALVKTLGVLSIVGEVNVQAEANTGRVLPTTDLLAWALGIEEEAITPWLDHLTHRRAILFRRADGYWTFTRGSDIDLEAEVALAIERRTPAPSQMRQLLERDAPLPFHLPRSYNQQRGMVRFFWGLYRWSNELKGVATETFLKQLGPTGYADGAVVYVLAANQAERKEAMAMLAALPAARVVFVIPERPLLITEPLRELFALRDLSNDAAFMMRDERLPREINFFIEDAQRRLRRSLRPLLEPGDLGASWWWYDGIAWRQERIQTEADVSRLLSRLCLRWFEQTPILNNELLNQQEPSMQQIRAAEKVIDALLSYQGETFPANLGLSGYGPDYLIFRTLLVRPGLLQATEENHEETSWHLRLPEDDEPFTLIWQEVEKFLESALENEQEVAKLIDTLQSPPYGLRRGVLPVILAAMWRFRLRVLTIRRNRKAVSPVNGEVLTELCQKPEHFTLEVGPWDERRAALWDILQEQFYSFVDIHEREQQPPSYLSLALLRWLQAQPRFCRDTYQISADAQRLRELIRKAQRDPARVLLYDLLKLLDDGSINLTDEAAYREALAGRLLRLMGEIATAYQTLLYHLDNFAESYFAANAPTRQRDGYSALNYWLTSLEHQSGQSLDTFRFSDTLAQRLVQAIRYNHEDGRFWDRLSHAVIGLHLNDWNDRSIDSFKNDLLNAKDRLEREILELTEDEEVVELNVTVSGEGEQIYRFRSSDLSPHGQHILQNFISTLEIAGRPLSPDEKRQVALALLHYVMDNQE